MSNVFKQLKAKFIKTSSIEHHKLLASQEKNYKINLLLLGCILITGALYLVEINGLSTKGYKIRELERSITVLQEENEKLSVAAIESRSMATLEKKINSFGMVASDKLSFVENNNVAMASR